VSSRPKIRSLPVVAAALDDQVVEADESVLTGPHTSKMEPVVGIPEYSATMPREGLFGVTLTPVIPLGAFMR
jgi:hypothetical protein